MSILNPVNFFKSALWRVSFALRESGQALERLGCTMQGIYSHDEISEFACSRIGAAIEPLSLSQSIAIRPSNQFDSMRPS
jgi:hypothetical protein